MNFAALQRFAPLLSFATKKSHELSDGDLNAVAQALAGEGANDMLPFLQTLRDQEPDQRVVEILASDTARKFFKQQQAARAEEDKVLFAKCPHCEKLFETEVS